MTYYVFGGKLNPAQSTLMPLLDCIVDVLVRVLPFLVIIASSCAHII